MPKARPYLKDGRLELGNNICERSIRPIALGRKNPLFMGSVGVARLLLSLTPSSRPPR